MGQPIPPLCTPAVTGPAVQGFDRDPQEDASQGPGRGAWRNLGMSLPTQSVRRVVPLGLRGAALHSDKCWLWVEERP